MKKRIACLALAVLLAVAGCAFAEQELVLPQSRYALTVPDGMTFSAPGDNDSGVYACFSEEIALEIDYTAYPLETAREAGMAATLQETAEKLAQQGKEAELRLVGGIEMLCYRQQDETDGTPCVGYIFEEDGWIIEIDFWYATEEAAEMTVKIMESIH